MTTPMDQCTTITVDRGVGRGTGLCVATAPHRFRLDDGRSRAVHDTVHQLRGAVTGAPSHRR